MQGTPTDYQKATTLHMIDDVVEFNTPIDDQHPFFTDFSDVRGDFEDRMIYRALKVDPKTFAYTRSDGNPNKAIVFLAGMRGSGKTSELAKIAHKLHHADCFFCVVCNLDDGLDINDMEYMDVLIFQITRLLEELNQRYVDIDNDVVASLQNWFGERVKEVNKAIKGESGLTVEIEAKTPSLFGFLGIATQVKAGLTGTKERAEKIRTEFKNNFTSFVAIANTFFERVNATLREKRIAKEILFVVDGLEKVATKDIRRRLIEDEINRIQQIKVNTIFTLPLELMSLRQKLIQFSTFATFPFVKVKDQNGDPIPAAMDRFRLFISKRIDASLFDSQATIDRAIEFGGGSPRELLRILQYANYWADEEKGQITAASLEKALQQLSGETVQYVTKQDLAWLKTLKENNEKGNKMPFDDDCQDLLEKIIVMEYNNGKFKRVNPVVEMSDLYQQYVG
jgi:hypothetical protein